MSDTPDISPAQRVVTRYVLWDGCPLPVTHLFDIEGDVVSDIAQAYSFVAGPLGAGGWLSGLVDKHPEIHTLKPH